NVGDSVSMMFLETFVDIEGVVSKVSDIKEQSDLGGQLQTIEIKVDNPGYTLEGVQVSNITIKTQKGLNISSLGIGTFTSNEAKQFKSSSSGTIKEIYINDGSYVSANELIIVLENDDLYDNLSDAQTSLSDAVTELNDIKNDSSFYTITSPIDGVVTTLNISEGDYVRSESTLAKVVNNYEIEFDIDVDELDILDLKIGQEAKVTIDAIEETVKEPLTGTVSEIALEGTTMNSVTSYPVTISLSGNDNIKMGMNCSAEIIVESAEDVLILPVEAIDSRREKYYVTLENNERKEVEVGIYNEDYIEIVSGLTEGDKVLLPATVSGVNAQNSEKQNMNQMSGFPGGGMSTGGSMPNGGRIPSGGMNMRGER
ncbi:MAG: efflux RND transporter periplasmic adaptor subunit, partial [Clostridia bacterium]|nr:efflux RND transporter periplasmic adaptor subunit [Clostridia bacterium]